MISSLENSRQNNVMDQPRQLVLASTSKYRRELLERLGLRFETAGPDCDESALHGEAAPETALGRAALRECVDHRFRSSGGERGPASRQAGRSRNRDAAAAQPQRQVRRLSYRSVITGFQEQ